MKAKSAIGSRGKGNRFLVVTFDHPVVFEVADTVGYSPNADRLQLARYMIASTTQIQSAGREFQGALSVKTAPLLFAPGRLRPMDTSPFSDWVSGNLTITLESQLKSGTFPTYSTVSGYGTF